MNAVDFGWFSPALGRTMRGTRWGSHGKPVLLFPTAAGDHREVERFGLVGTLAPMIAAGRVRVYSVESISGEGWLHEGGDPAHKIGLQDAFDRYLLEELVPMVRHEVGDALARLITAGASIGAYNAVNAVTRHPDLFWLAIAMSGTYDFQRFVGPVGGAVEAAFHVHQPLRSLPGLPEGPQLEWLRRSFFLLASGQGRWEAPWETTALGEVLAARHIPHQVELWGYDVDHDWPTWRTMLPMFLDRFA